MMTKAQYIDSLRGLHLNLYSCGKKVENVVDNPIVRPSLNSFAATYELAEDPQYEDLMTATSNLTGKKVNRFTHLHQSTDDLIKKVKMQRLLGQKTAACFQRCVGMDAANAVYSTAFETDEACGTKYHENFVKFWTDVQNNDWGVDGAMTDVKGDRGLSPSKQADPDRAVRFGTLAATGLIVGESQFGVVYAGIAGATGSESPLELPFIGDGFEPVAAVIGIVIIAGATSML